MDNYVYKVNTHYKELIKDCIEKCKAIDIPISTSITFRENTGYSRYGYCKKTAYRDSDYVIAINKWFVYDEAIIATIMHELIHSCRGCYNHGEKFHLYAMKIRAHYGIKVTVVGNHKLKDEAYKNKGIRRNVFKPSDFDKATMVMMYCPKCNNTFAIKKSSFRIGARWMCKKCREKLLYL